MRKDLLLSLLAAGVTPLGALANVNVNDQIPAGDKWQITGLASEGFTTAGWNPTVNQISLDEATAGYLETTITNLLPGKTYVLGFQATNAVVTVNGEVVENGGKFTLGEDQTTAKVVVSHEETAAFAIGNFNLYIEFDNQAAKAALEALMPDVPQVDPADDSEEAEALKAYYNENYKALVDTINTNLAKLGGEDVSFADYVDLNLEDYPGGDVITGEINDLKDALTEDYTTRVAAENALYANVAANIVTLNKIDLSKINSVNWILNNTTEEDGPLTKSLLPTVENLKGEYNRIKGEIDTLKANREALEATPEDFKASEAYTTIKDDAAAFQTTVTALAKVFHNYQDDQDPTWKQIWDNPTAPEDATTMANLDNLYKTVLNYLMSLTNSQIAPEKAGYFADKIVELKDIYDTAVAEVNAKIPEDATSAIPADGPEVNKPNFKAELDSVIGIISTAQTAMYNLKAEVKGQVQEYQDKIDASDAAVAAADAALAILRTNLNDITIDAKKVGEVEGANMYQNLTGDKTAIQEKIDAIKTRIDEAAETFNAKWYNDPDGNNTDGEAVDAIQAEIDALKGYVADAAQAYTKYSAAQAAIGNQLQYPLDVAKSDLIDEQDEAPQTKYNVVAATNGAYKALNTDIAEFKVTAAESYKEYAEGYKNGKTSEDVASTIDTSSPVYTYIVNGINNYKTLGSQLIQDFKNADTTVAGLEAIKLGDTDGGWIKTWSDKAMEGNTRLEGALEAINTVKSETNEEITGLRKLIDDAFALGNGQEMLTAIEAAITTINSSKDNIEATVANAKADFMAAIENGNLDVVKTLYTNVNDTWINPQADKEPVIGSAHWTTVSTAGHNIYDALYLNNDATIPGKLNSALTAADKEAAYTKIDTDLKNLVSQLNQIVSDCEKYKVNEEVNAALQTLIANAQNNINSASTTVDTKTFDPAKDTLQKRIGEQQTALNTTSAAINTQYTSAGTDDLLTVEDKAAYEEAINKVAQDATTIESNALINEDNHNILLGLATTTGDKVQAALDQAATLGDSEAVTAAIEAINAEKDKLTPLNNDVSDAYKNINLCGENDQTAALKARYDAIAAAVEEALTSAQSDYQSAIYQANYGVFKNTFMPLWNELNDATSAGFKAYNAYNYNTNAAYKAGVAQYTDALYETLSKYRNAEGGLNQELLQNALNYINTLLLNVKPGEEGWDKDDVTILTPETPEFKAFCDDAISYKQTIDAAVNTMETSANTYAEQYFNNIYDPAKTLVDNAETEMRAAMTNAEIADPIIDKLIGEFQGDLATAKSMKDAIEAEGEALSPRMDPILDILEKYTPEEVKLRTEAAGNTYWIKVYGNAKTAMDEAKAEIDKLENLTDAQKQGYKDTIEGKKTAAGILNIEEAGDYARYELLKNLKSLNDRLDAVLSEVNTEVTNAQAADKKVVDNREAYNKWLEVVVDLNDAYFQMAGWVGALGLPAEEINKLQITGIKSNIDRFENNIKAHEEDVLSQEELYTAIQSRIEGDINAMYFTAYREELEFLQGRLQDVAEALTELSLSNPDLENYDELNNRINDLAEEISNDVDAAKPTDDYTATAVLDKLRGYEDAINALGEEIAGDDWKPVTGNTDAIVEALNNKYDEIKGNIEAEQTVLEGCEQSVQDEFKEALDTLALDLDGLKDQIDNLGTAIIALEGTYNDAMDAIAAQLETITNDIKAADAAAKAEAQKQAISDAAYETLNAELAALQTQLDNAKQTVEGYETIDQEAYAPMISNVQGLIDAAQNELDEDKADYALTADSTLPNKAQIENGISTLLKTATDAETTHQIATANAALKEAADFITAGQFLNAEELDNRLNQLKDAANTLVATDNAELAPGVIATAKLIAEQAEALLKDAKDNKVVVGDLTDDDIINVNDLQDLMDIILGDDGNLDDMTKARADVNGDGKISAADIVALVDIVMGRSLDQVKINANRPAQVGENSISIYNVGSENGVTRYAICLNNAATFVNGQMDINLPAGMEIVNEAVAERASSLELMSRDHADGTHRILLASYDINEIADNQGALIYIDVEGAGNFTVDNVIFADANARAYALDGTSSDTTALQTITNGLKNLGDKIYNASGVMMDKIQKGINIIRKSDGSTQKTIGK